MQPRGGLGRRKHLGAPKHGRWGPSERVRNRLDPQPGARHLQQPPGCDRRHDLRARYEHVWLVVDGSGSMDDAFEADRSRWGNGKDLACNKSDGWTLSDPRTVQLTGSACNTFLASMSVVTAKFACDIFVPD